MKDLQLVPLLLFIFVGFAGMAVHWLKKHKRGEVIGTFYDYMMADYPGRSISTVTVFVGLAFTAAATGSLDGIDLAQFVAQLGQGGIHMSTINTLTTGFMLGWTLDSGINKGA